MLGRIPGAMHATAACSARAGARRADPTDEGVVILVFAFNVRMNAQGRIGNFYQCAPALPLCIVIVEITHPEYFMRSTRTPLPIYAVACIGFALAVAYGDGITAANRPKRDSRLGTIDSVSAQTVCYVVDGQIYCSPNDPARPASDSVAAR